MHTSHLQYNNNLHSIISSPTASPTFVFSSHTLMGILILLLILLFIHIHHSGHHKEARGTATRGCDLSQGNWIADESYPLYNTSDCPFILKQFDCITNGRPDKNYVKYRWHPNNCNLPRFNGEELLRRLRGKSILFVGDSLSLNQWQSLTCMLHTAVPRANYTSVRTGSLSTFTFPRYDVKVKLSRNAFLVDIGSERIGRVLKLDSIEGGKKWIGNDILIFDSWHWWLHIGRKQPWDFIREGNHTYKDMDRLVAYEKGLKTWAKWVEDNVNPNKTRVFFQGVSPDHLNGGKWGEAKARFCEGQMVPGSGLKYSGGSHPAEIVLQKVLGGMSKHVNLLNITSLSQMRKDGHPSLYGFGGKRSLDCSHWCLPGVPDTWNLLLYAALIQN